MDQHPLADPTVQPTHDGLLDWLARLGLADAFEAIVVATDGDVTAASEQLAELADQIRAAYVAELAPNLTAEQSERLQALLAKSQDPNAEPLPDADRPGHLHASVRLRDALDGSPLQGSSPQLDGFDAETERRFLTWPGCARWQQRLRAAVLAHDDDAFDALADYGERVLQQIQRAQLAQLHRQAMSQRRPPAPVIPCPSRSRRAGYRRTGARAARTHAVRSGPSPPADDDDHHPDLAPHRLVGGRCR